MSGRLCRRNSSGPRMACWFRRGPISCSIRKGRTARNPLPCFLTDGSTTGTLLRTMSSSAWRSWMLGIASGQWRGMMWPSRFRARWRRRLSRCGGSIFPKARRERSWADASTATRANERRRGTITSTGRRRKLTVLSLICRRLMTGFFAATQHSRRRS